MKTKEELKEGEKSENSGCDKDALQSSSSSFDDFSDESYLGDKELTYKGNKMTRKKRDIKD